VTAGAVVDFVVVLGVTTEVPVEVLVGVWVVVGVVDDVVHEANNIATSRKTTKHDQIILVFNFYLPLFSY